MSCRQLDLRGAESTQWLTSRGCPKLHASPTRPPRVLQGHLGSIAPCPKAEDAFVSVGHLTVWPGRVRGALVSIQRDHDCARVKNHSARRLLDWYD
jgi:hypothetical protein